MLTLEEINLFQLHMMLESNLSPHQWIQNFSAKFRECVNRGEVNFEIIKKSLYS